MMKNDELTVVGSHLSDECSVTSVGASFDIQNETINDSSIEGTGAASTVSKKSPKLVSIALCLRGAGKPVCSNGTTCSIQN